MTETLITTVNVLCAEDGLQRIVRSLGRPVDTAFCYWNESQAYACVLLKRAGLIKKVVTRAHGLDIYEERRPSSFMPLKRQFISEIDAILPISKNGAQYIEKMYDYPKERLLVSPLGVHLPSTESAVTSANRLNILSVSYCLPVKRIDRIIRAIEILASKRQDLVINWTHIGGGELLDQLKKQAADLLQHSNVSYTFFGPAANTEIHEFYRTHPVDVFVNTSDSEGVPVSIMEAMSHGIPAIAPAIGGIPELLNSECGQLLAPQPSPAEIANCLAGMTEKAKSSAFRHAARTQIERSYNADKNYRQAVSFISTLS